MGIFHINSGPEVRANTYIMATVTMTVSEFIQFEILAYKRIWDFKVKQNSVEVTAEEQLLRELGFQD